MLLCAHAYIKLQKDKNMTKFAYEDLSTTQFEELVIFICQRLLGFSVQGFAEGPDGGRDAKFIGIADLHPSKASPWDGITIVQAKHTNGLNRSFSESDFFSETSTNTVLSRELVRVVKLVKDKQLDNYMLFSNRKLTGNMESKIRAHISKNCNIPEESIYICGVEQIELWLKNFPDIVKQAELDPVDSPLIVSPDELAEIVEVLAENIEDVLDDDPPTPRISYKDKNQINNMSDSYAENYRRRYLKETNQIKSFLADPNNIDFLRRYETAIDEFQLKIISKRKNYQQFDEVMEYLIDLLFKRDPVLKKNKKLTRAILFYMYWNCDIGESEVASQAN